MTIELFNSLLTAGVPVKVPSQSIPPVRVHRDHIDRIRDYYNINGAPSTDQIDRQNKRVQEHCKTIMG